MYIEINTDKAKAAIDEFKQCKQNIDQASSLLNEVYSSLGQFSGSSVPELRRKIKQRESGLQKRKISVQSMEEVLEKILHHYRKTETSILNYEDSGRNKGKSLGYKVYK